MRNKKSFKKDKYELYLTVNGKIVDKITLDDSNIGLLNLFSYEN